MRLKALVILIMLVLLCNLSFAYNIFSPESPPGVAPGQVCLISGGTGCNMSGPIYMNNNNIYDGVFINATWVGIIYINATQVLNEYWVNESGDIMTGDLNMNNNDIQNVGEFTNFFDTMCPGNQYIYDINDNGSFSCGTPIDTWWPLGGSFLYNCSGSLCFDESKLNDTIDARDTDTWWPIAGYLINDSGNLNVNESMLNKTISGVINFSEHWVDEEGDTMSGDLNMSFHNISEVATIRADYYGSNSPIRFVDENGTVIAQMSTTNYTGWGSEYGDIVARTITVDRLIIRGLLNYSNTEPPDVWDADEIYINEFNFTFYFNESMLNNTIDTKIVEFNFSRWPLGDDYLVNCSGSLCMNESKLNATIETVSNETDPYFHYYFIYNQSTGYLELWVNNTKQQEWGNSTNVYGKATFYGNSFFQNMTGNDLLIDANVRVAYNINVSGWYYGNGSRLEGVCLTNGSGCGPNQTDTRIKSTPPYLYDNSTHIFFNESRLNITIQGNLNDTDTHIQGDGVYLYDNYTTMFLNESKLNNTITSLADVKAYEYNFTVVVSGGTGSAVSGQTFNYLITQVTVYPPTTPISYHFELNETTSGDIIDRDRKAHTGVWDIYKQHSLNDSVTATITNSNQDGNFTVRIKYIDNVIQV